MAISNFSLVYICICWMWQDITAVVVALPGRHTSLSAKNPLLNVIEEF